MTTQCPLLAQNGHSNRVGECLLLGVKRTLPISRPPLPVSQLDPLRCRFAGADNETARIHHIRWWRGELAACGSRSARRADAADRRANGLAGELPSSAVLGCGAPG